MRCVMTNGLYLRADGRLPCYCGAGETVTLGRYVPGQGTDFVEDIFQKGMFAHIRASQSRDLVPFPGVCDQCSYLEPDAPFDDEQKLLRWFHWEPTTRCMLGCEWCNGSRGDDIPMFTMDMAMFTGIIDSFARTGYRLGKGNICGVGEPTINNDLWKMVRYAKDKLGGDILVSTNGNGPYSGELVPSGIDKVKIAIDSTKQEQYQRYRQHGSIDKVIEFTRKIAQDKQKRGSQTPKLIWQYIMFDFNDSDQELLDLQNQAREIGVNALRIVYTRCNNYSQKLVKDFPVAFDDIDFFQIKQESLLTVQTAKARLAEAQGLVGSVELAKAASSCIALINDTYKRLLLGVETYRDLLDAVYNPQELLRSGARSLPAEEARALYDTVVAAFFTLVEIYGRMDKADHAGKYLKFMGKVGMVTV